MKAGLTLATLFWMRRTAVQSFLAIRPGSWCVPTRGQPRCTRPRPQRVGCFSGFIHRLIRTSALSPRFGRVQISSHAIMKKGGEHAQRVPPEDVGLWEVSAGNFHTCAVRGDGQLVCFALRHLTAMGSVTCKQIQDQFWQSQQAIFTLVQCGQMFWAV